MVEIIINLNKTNDDSPSSIVQNSRRQQRGMLEAPRKDDYLPRRKKKGIAFVNFYDLTEYFSGESLQEFDYTVTPEFANYDYLDGHTFESLLTAYGSQIKDKYNLPLQFALADWKTKFKKLTPLDSKRPLFFTEFQPIGENDYIQQEIYLTENNQFDNERGFALKTKPSENYFFVSNSYKNNETVGVLAADSYFYTGLYQSFALSNFIGAQTIKGMAQYPNTAPLGRWRDYPVKITAVPSYLAESVTPDLEDKDLNVFLNRQIFTLRMKVYRVTEGEPDYPREENDTYYFLKQKFTSFNNSMVNSSDSNPRTNEPVYWTRPLYGDLIRLLAKRNDAREYYYNPDTSVLIERTTKGLFENVVEQADDLTGIIYWETSTGIEYLTSQFNHGAVQVPGSLIGAVNQGEKWFFLWVDELP